MTHPNQDATELEVRVFCANVDELDGEPGRSRTKDDPRIRDHILTVFPIADGLWVLPVIVRDLAGSAYFRRYVIDNGFAYFVYCEYFEYML